MKSSRLITNLNDTKIKIFYMFFINIFANLFIDQIRQTIYFNELFSIFSIFTRQKYIETMKNHRK